MIWLTVMCYLAGPGNPFWLMFTVTLVGLTSVILDKRLILLAQGPAMLLPTGALYYTGATTNTGPWPALRAIVSQPR